MRRLLDHPVALQPSARAFVFARLGNVLRCLRARVYKIVDKHTCGPREEEEEEKPLI